jgi:hypothetical protein
MRREHEIALPKDKTDYERLKKLDELLDIGQQAVNEAQHVYRETLREFATLCRQLWQQEKAQGSRQGKGFRQSLKNEGIKVGRAYRAMRKFFPADFPSQKPKGTETAPGCVLRFTGKPLPDSREVLECTFTLTPEEKAEFLECVQVLDPAQVQQLMLQAVRQAAASKLTVTDEHQSEIANKINGCNIVSLGGESGSPGTRGGMGLQLRSQRTKLQPAPKPSQENRDNTENRKQSKGSKGNNANQNNGHKHKKENTPAGEIARRAASAAFERLCDLQQRLDLQGFPDLFPLAASYSPESLQARLDWVDAHPVWCDKLRGRPGAEFIRAFQRDTAG